MIIDKQLEMSSAQVVTAAAASTNVIDLGSAGDAVEHELYVVVQVDTTTDSAGDAAVCTFKLETSVDEAFTSPIVLAATAAIPQASLTAGAIPVKMRLPIGCKRYFRVYYGVATADFTAGKFNAFLTANVKVA